MPIVTKDVLKKISEKRETNEAAEAVIPTTPTNPIDENEAANLIHKYAVLHAAVAFALGPFAGFALTIITVKMISELSNRCGNVGITQQGITNFVAHYGGLLAGIGIAQLIAGLIPGIGNLSNAVSSFVVTQIIGWATFTSFKRDGNFIISLRNISKDECKAIINKIPMFKDMNKDEKENLAEWLEALFKGNTKQEIDKAKKEIKKILISYGQNILQRYGMDKTVERLNQFKEQFMNKWANRATDTDYQEIENKLLAIVHSEKFQRVSANDRTAFALNLQILLGRTANQNQRLAAQTAIKAILDRYGIEF